MEAGKRTISDIFNGNRVLEIPFFQRAYVWCENEWERLLEDMKLVSASSKHLYLTLTYKNGTKKKCKNVLTLCLRKPKRYGKHKRWNRKFQYLTKPPKTAKQFSKN